MNTFENKTQDNVHIDFKLPENNMIINTRSETKQKFKPKTNLPVLPDSVRLKRSAAVSRAGQHRWPQATLVVMGGEERQVFNTELLTVTTFPNKPEDFVDDERSFKGKECSTSPLMSLPNIAESERARGSQEKDSCTPSGFTVKSPSKFAQIPAFSKNLLHQNSKRQKKETTKSIRSIKFWRGTTPNTSVYDTVTAEKETEISKKFDEKTSGSDDLLSKHDSISPNWNEHLTVFEESNESKYFSWQMALHNRLLKHEKMYYQEAVSRINKYRQQLKQKSHGKNTSRRPPPLTTNTNMNIPLLKTSQHKNGEKKQTSTAEKPTEVRMSPTHEWKPLIVKGNSKGKQMSPFLDSSNGNNEIKKTLNITADLESSATSNRCSRNQHGGGLPGFSYPVQGEGLVKSESLKSNNIALTNCDTTNRPLNKEKTKGVPNHATSEENENSSTRALLVDLKNQLIRKNNENQEKKDNTSVKNQISGNNFQRKNDWGMKLKLLLQNNNQNKHDRNSIAREAETALTKTRSRLYSQQNGYRPISRPRTIGDGTLPKIHNIVTTSLWKRHRGNKNPELRSSGTKHRLTLAGIANREVFSSSVIGIAQKHLQERPKDSESKSIQRTDGNKTELADTNTNLQDNKNEHPLSSLVSSGTSLLNDSENANGNEQTNHLDSTYKLKKKKNRAYRLYTPATVHQHQFSSTASLSGTQRKENPQFRSLKLVTSTSDKQTSPPATPLEQFHARQQILNGKRNSPKKEAKNKVLRIAIIEPPFTAKERFEKQPETEKSKKRLTINQTHVPTRNLSAAILNSELDLRAPSSSPVDMLFHQKDLATYWSSQKQSENLRLANAIDGTRESPSEKNHLINQMDGVAQPQLPTNVEGVRPNSNHLQTNMKRFNASRLKELVDLQKLYDVMQKHGEAFTSGSTYFYNPTPNVGLDGMSKQQAPKHGNERNLNKIPFFYFPYYGDTNIQAVNEDEGAPLYVVTGVNSMGSEKNSTSFQKRKKNAHYQSRAEYQPKYDEVFVETPYRHILSLNKQEFSQWSAKPRTQVGRDKNGKNALTIVMPKTPGMGLSSSIPVSQLDQVQEHVIQ